MCLSLVFHLTLIVFHTHIVSTKELVKEFFDEFGRFLCVFTFCLCNFLIYHFFVYLTIIPRTRVGYELLDSGRGAKHRVGYYKLISNKREWNNCFIKYQTHGSYIHHLSNCSPRGFSATCLQQMQGSVV